MIDADPVDGAHEVVPPATADDGPAAPASDNQSIPVHSAPRPVPRLVPGTLVEGTVSGITHFGAFLNLDGGHSGLVHISEIAHQYVRDVRDHLKMGERVRVKVLQLNPTNGKYDLSLKQTTEVPADAAPIRWRRGKAKVLPEGADPIFEDKLTKFLKSSEERQLDLRRNIDAKRGGRYR